MSTSTANLATPWQTFTRKTRLFVGEIRVEQTLFTLPFAYATLFLVEQGWPSAAHFAWITLAMVGARTIGMSANRLIDAAIDARNERTARRAIPSGLLRAWEFLLFMAAALALFLVAVYHLSPWAQRLWPLAIAALVIYPYTKRWTWLCHFGLGLVYGMVPNGVWLAVSNHLTRESLLLGTGAGFWAVGFDTLYGTQDIAFDRANGIHSIPADLGLERALWLAKAFHATTVGCIVGAGIALDAGAWYFVGAAAFFAVLVYEHRIVSPRDLSRVNFAFFNMNGAISLVFFVFVMIDVLTR